MKTIRVVAAIIKCDDDILIAKRKGGDFNGMWEFPGGKIEANEEREAALIREIREELEIMINVDEFFMNVTYDYPTFHLDMDCFICSTKESVTHLNDHSDICWINVNEDHSNVDWVPADIQVINAIVDKYKNDDK